MQCNTYTYNTYYYHNTYPNYHVIVLAFCFYKVVERMSHPFAMWWLLRVKPVHLHFPMDIMSICPSFQFPSHKITRRLPTPPPPPPKKKSCDAVY